MVGRIEESLRASGPGLFVAGTVASISAQPLREVTPTNHLNATSFRAASRIRVLRCRCQREKLESSLLGGNNDPKLNPAGTALC